MLKLFLNSHGRLCQGEIRDYLNLYAFVINAPFDHLEKVKKSSIWFWKIPNRTSTETGSFDLRQFCQPSVNRNFININKTTFNHWNSLRRYSKLSYICHVKLNKLTTENEMRLIFYDYN